ncbi:MAG: peptidase M14, partial [Acidobacteria bacterium]|nr:peptidase M14 [Acidobacteriota bacterium]
MAIGNRSAGRTMPAAALTLLILLASPTARAQRNVPPSLEDLETRPERTGFAETSRYQDVMEFLRAVAAASPDIHLTTFGYSFEGRPLPLAVVGRVKDAGPDAVRAAGKTRVYIQGNIHAGEVEGKEACLELLRAIARKQHEDWLESMILLVGPIYNPDGNERVNLTNRGSQHGPIGGMGQRATAQNYDLNRDHTKLDAPESRSLAQMFGLYDPHLAVDLHTTNGTVHAYHLTYAPPLHPATAPEVTDFLRKGLLPAVTRAIREKDGWDFYFYGNVPGGRGGAAAERAWHTTEPTPRYSANYFGLRNRMGILSEAF